MRWIVAGLLFASALRADQDTGVPEIPVHHLQLGPDVFWTHYRSGFERDSEGMKLTASIDGYYGGLRFAYDYLQPDALYAGTESIVAWGRDDLHTKNSQSRLSSAAGSSGHTSTHEHQTRLWINVEQRLGYNSQSTVFPQFIATPYLGLGWHYEGTSHDNAHWYFGSAGLKTMQKFYERFELGIDLKLMYGFDIRDRGFISMATTQGKKSFWGFETALPLRWILGDSGKWDFEFKPYLLKLNLNSPQTIVGASLMVGYIP